MNFDFEETLKKYIDSIDSRLDKLLEIKYPEKICEAMRYSIFAGGKRLRPVLLLAACEMFGKNKETAVNFACALEMIHTYSLIHDDLPAMDNDDFRRGKLTCHKKFGDAIAILAGDALLNKAYEVMTDAIISENNIRFAKAMKYISDASGVSGMVGGQVVDILSESQEISPDTLLYIHKNKTAALITAPLKAGGVIGGCSDDEILLLEKIGNNIGIAFQIKDDILDITSSIEVLGKPVLSDEKNNKITYVTMYGIEKSEKDIEALTNEALSIIEKFDKKGDFLYQYIKNLVVRVK